MFEQMRERARSGQGHGPERGLHVETALALVLALLDFRFKTSVAIRMLPTVYLTLIAGIAALSVGMVAEAFGRSFWQGLMHLLVIGPAYFVAGVVVIRVCLELVFAVFRISSHMEDISALSQDITGLGGLRDAIRSWVPASGQRER